MHYSCLTHETTQNDLITDLSICTFDVMETTLLASGGADPPDASTWERSAVIYVALMLLVLISLHVRWECRKQMKWEQISWEHVAEGRDRSRVRALSVFRLCCCLVVLANDGILIFFTREMPLLGGPPGVLEVFDTLFDDLLRYTIEASTSPKETVCMHYML